MPINGKDTYYEFFGLLNFENDMIKIKSAYRGMALKWHPDRHKLAGDKITAERMMKQVNEIWLVLSQQKDSYDSYLQKKLNPKNQYQQQTHTSADAWSTTGGSTWEFDIETMMRHMRKEKFEKDLHNQTRMKNIKMLLDILNDRQLERTENFIMSLL